MPRSFASRPLRPDCKRPDGSASGSVLPSARPKPAAALRLRLGSVYWGGACGSGTVEEPLSATAAATAAACWPTWSGALRRGVVDDLLTIRVAPGLPGPGPQLFWLPPGGPIIARAGKEGASPGADGGPCLPGIPPLKACPGTTAELCRVSTGGGEESRYERFMLLPCSGRIIIIMSSLTITVGKAEDEDAGGDVPMGPSRKRGPALRLRWQALKGGTVGTGAGPETPLGSMPALGDLPPAAGL